MRNLRVLSILTAIVAISTSNGCGMVSVEEYVSMRESLYQGSATMRREHLTWAKNGVAPLRQPDYDLRVKWHREYEDTVTVSRSRYPAGLQVPGLGSATMGQ